MEAIKKITHISNNIISFEELKNFNGQDVEVIIFPIENAVENKKCFMDFAGDISDEEAIGLIKSLNECRKVDIESWN